MRIVSVTVAKNRLSSHLQFVRRGGRVRILDRGTPVADLVPIEHAGADDDDDVWLAAIEARGLATRGSGAVDPDLLRPGPADPKGLLLQALLDERRRR